MEAARKPHLGIDIINDIRGRPGHKDILAPVGGDGDIEVKGGAASAKGAGLDDFSIHGVKFIKFTSGIPAAINRVDLKEGIADLGAGIDEASVRGVEGGGGAWLRPVCTSTGPLARDGPGLDSGLDRVGEACGLLSYF